MPKSRKERPSSTPGKQKDKNCQKSEIKNMYCLDTKFYRKDPKNYAAACKLIDSHKGNHKSTWYNEILEEK